MNAYRLQESHVQLSGNDPVTIVRLTHEVALGPVPSTLCAPPSTNLVAST